MHRHLVAGLAGAIVAMSPGLSSGAEPRHGPRYPEAPRSDTVDDYHGTRIADPYRPLEDPDSPETRAWVEAENKVTAAFLEAIPAREAIKKRLTELWNYEKFGVPDQEGGRYFYTRNSGLQNQGVLYTIPALDAEPKVLLDPNTLSSDGTVALTETSVSHDGALLAYGLAAAGSDWQEWRIRDVASGRDRDDRLKWIKFSGASWTKDCRGFYYSRFPEPGPGEDLKGVNYYQKLYFHQLGTPQSDDVLVYERPDHKEWEFRGHATEDGRYLIITVAKGTDDKYRILYKPLDDPNAPIVELIGNFDHEYSFLDNDGPVFWFKTDRDAPRGRLIAIDTRSPESEQWKELIPQAEETLNGVGVVGGRFIASYLKDAHTRVKVFELDGTFVREVDLPGLGTATGFGGKRSDRETFYAFASFTTPPTIYRYDVASGESRVFRKPKLAFDPGDYQTTQVFYRSKDGTRVPMFLGHKKGISPDDKTPALLYGYGGFNVPLTPAFSASNLVWMEMGGLYAQPNLRGGGEYGEAWHEAGTKLKKRNVFDDFIAAAEWLIEHEYTATPRLAIAGGSNGGLLVGACMARRPDLFGAALPAVGVMDMLRFHKFTIGWAWVDDYGSSDDPEQFKALLAYSPLHNLKPGTCYPPTLITTADHDDRVVPAHSFKFAAAIQAAQSCDHPVLIRIETRAGHGAGKPTTKIIEEAADRWAFLVKVLGVPRPGNGP
ncbi:MAG TPA: prolyl oligopeptidase family serine peptidase [Isosphaeraceae bacterium]|nr:prolyl oligopeptidase family serine peptidase [Isosphaeraceae bacterium]